MHVVLSLTFGAGLLLTYLSLTAGRQRKASPSTHADWLIRWFERRDRWREEGVLAGLSAAGHNKRIAPGGQAEGDSNQLPTAEETS